MKPPNTPANGVARWNVDAACQSTLPATTGTTAESNASSAEPNAIGTASRDTQRTPQRLTAVNVSTSTIASSWTGTPGRYH